MKKLTTTATKRVQTLQRLTIGLDLGDSRDALEPASAVDHGLVRSRDRESVRQMLLDNSGQRMRWVRRVAPQPA